MKHLDINPLIAAVKNIELQEARTALDAYGGRCTFDSDNPPYVNHEGSCGPARSAVKQIRYSGKRREVVVEVWDGDNGGTVNLRTSDLFPGSLQEVIEYM